MKQKQKKMIFSNNIGIKIYKQKHGHFLKHSFSKHHTFQLLQIKTWNRDVKCQAKSSNHIMKSILKLINFVSLVVNLWIGNKWMLCCIITNKTSWNLCQMKVHFFFISNSILMVRAEVAKALKRNFWKIYLYTP